eukprot:GHVR01001754.1.p1 GENE.GHVR01001754.1~~GHVR01001754.1.p1  ORF type:complete len:239 (-),score=42.74 GHVR01001754.1:174-890(-)
MVPVVWRCGLMHRDASTESIEACCIRSKISQHVTLVTEVRSTNNVRFLDADFWWPQCESSLGRTYMMTPKERNAYIHRNDQTNLPPYNFNTYNNHNEIERERDVSRVNYLDSPEYAAGRVLVDHMLYSLVSQSKYVCHYAVGVCVLEALLGCVPESHPTGLLLVPLDRELVGATFKSIVIAYARRGEIPIGFYRDALNPYRLPYVCTCPPPSTIASCYDQLYVIPSLRSVAHVNICTQ